MSFKRWDSSSVSRTKTQVKLSLLGQWHESSGITPSMRLESSLTKIVTARMLGMDSGALFAKILRCVIISPGQTSSVIFNTICFRF